MARGRAANGSGTIRQRKDGTWEARYTVGRDPGTGKLIRKSVYGKSADEVSKKQRAATAAIDDGQYVEPERMPLKQWVKIWLDEYTGGVKPGTVGTYESNCRVHILPAIGAVPLSELRPHDCQKFINSLSKKTYNGKLMKPKMVKNIHGTLHKALQTAVRVGYIRSNPSDNTELPRIDREEIRPLEGTQIESFLKAIAGDSFEPLFFVALFTGMRLSELLGLQWKCVDFTKGIIKIDKQLLIKRGKDTQREFGSPKNGKPRTIKAAPAVMDTLKAVKKQQLGWKLQAGQTWTNTLDLVYTYENGACIPHATVEHRYKRIVTAIGVPDRRFHDLRHTYATESIHAGVPVKTLSEYLGHSSVAFTLDVYGHVTEEMKDEAATCLQAAIERIRNA